MFPFNPMFQFIQQVQMIRQNPGQLATLLRQRGMISDEQISQIQQMGNNYEEIGRYLMGNGKLPNNVQQYQGQIEQIKNMMK